MSHLILIQHSRSMNTVNEEYFDSRQFGFGLETGQIMY
jgi:hypothetical protein